MSTASKQLSNPYSTGGGGVHFEAHIQASFVTLMLTGGYAPCLPCWPIVEIKLQGKIDGFDTDDLIVFVEQPETGKRRKLLGQVKHSIAITQGSTQFAEVVQAAWNDFNNSSLFTKGKDIIALITGPISATDEHNVQWLLGQARHTKDMNEFFRNVEQANFSPAKSIEKLAAIQHHLKSANNGSDIPKEDLYAFLNHFHLLGYDLGREIGVILSLLHSHISQFQQQHPQWLWSRIVDVVQTWNQDAGTITLDKLPEDLKEAFIQPRIAHIPQKLITTQPKPITDWNQLKYATDIAIVNLIGEWNEKNEADISIVKKITDEDYSNWSSKAREILLLPDSPFLLKNGLWRITKRADLWDSLGSRIFDQNLDTFKTTAVTVLNERDPSFELPKEERCAVSLYGKTLTYSPALRKGLAEGLAILGSNPDALINCSVGKAETTAILAIREIFASADWVLWGSLNNLLPNLAEAAPDEFLDAVENALQSSPCPFDELFSQEGEGITGGNYLTGLLWALEGLAWDEKYLVRVCVILGELASHDPGGQWSNRPANSLLTIFLPWRPQTLAPTEKRQVAVQTLSKEWPDIAWKLIIQLLPGQHQVSSGSHKPTWRYTIPEDWKEGVSQDEYRQQVSFYAELAVELAGYEPEKLAELAEHFHNLPEPAFNHLIEILSSPNISALPEEQRSLIWNRLITLTSTHRRFADAKWALSDNALIEIETIAEKLAPTDPFNRYQYLFSDSDFELFDALDNWEEQQNNLYKRREMAIAEILQRDGIDQVIRFAKSVLAPDKVGHALGTISDQIIEQTFLPGFLGSENKKHSALVRGFIWERHHKLGWEWCDNVDKSGWTSKQTSYFLACLPFTKEAWRRAEQWLGENQNEYWTLTGANAYQADGELEMAIDKLLEYGRPLAAIHCLVRMRQTKQAINIEQCIRALLAALSSNEPTSTMDGHHIVELIKFLQSESSVPEEDLSNIEWAYLPLLDRHNDAAPKLLESRLANDPEFFCEVIKLAYRSKKADHSQKELSEELTAKATNAWRLLHEWKTLPGTQQDGIFSANHFTEWLRQVKTLCSESGRLEVALVIIGEVLIHSPADPDGLWIHRTIAEALNDRNAGDMRDGYRTGTYNARGIHWVDPTGKPEKELATQFHHKADEVENAGFHRLAATLRDVAEGYEREAKRVMSETT